ncbi:MAG: hypothetical protein M3010_08430, partial [Candidatus Dormibacteraeota bacterium]|nr:hypothetical protein [Candidatus Dormibacteraeota bacterium]
MSQAVSPAGHDTEWLPLAVTAAAVVAAAIGITIAISPITAILGLGAAAVLGLVAASWKRPAVALVLLVFLLPVYPVLGGMLLTAHVPSAAIAPLRFWKEVLVAALAVKVTPTVFRERDAADNAALAFLGFLLFYLLLPIGPPFDARLLGARVDGFFLVVFLVARHVGLSRRAALAIQVAVILEGCVVGGFGLWNHFSQDAWVRWVGSVGLARYTVEVTGDAARAPLLYSTLAGTTFVRAGSLFLNAVSLAYFMVIPIGVMVGRGVVRSVGRLDVLAAPVCLGGLLVALTRSSIAVLPLILALGMLLGRGRSRLAVAVVTVAAILAILPLAASLGLGG